MFSIKSCYLLQFICLGAQAEEEEAERGLTETESEEAYCVVSIKLLCVDDFIPRKRIVQEYKMQPFSVFVWGPRLPAARMEEDEAEDEQLQEIIVKVIIS